MIVTFIIFIIVAEGNINLSVVRYGDFAVHVAIIAGAYSGTQSRRNSNICVAADGYRAAFGYITIVTCADACTEI